MGNFISFIQKLRVRGDSYGNIIPSLDLRLPFIERPFVCSSDESATSACRMTLLMVIFTLLGRDVAFNSSGFVLSVCPIASPEISLKPGTAMRTIDSNTIKVLNSRTVS